MRLKIHAIALMLLLSVALVGVLSLSNPAATAGLGVASVTTPSPGGTSTTAVNTVTTTSTSTISTTSISTSVVTTSTSTSTTSVSTWWSYTNTVSTTQTTTSTQTSLTSTSTTTSPTTETTSTTTSQATTTTLTSTQTTAKLPSCLIATATFGSELSPEVQLLRNFRDNQILLTSAGSSFMVVFNAWYYSFSPYVAGYLTTHTFERTVMKGVLYPLIGILKLSSLTFSVTSAVPELAAFLSGLVASSLIGALYLGLPLSLLRAKVRRLRGSNAQGRLERSLAAMLLAGILALLVGEILAASVLLMIASVAILLSTLFLSAVFTSGRISRKLQ